MSQPNRGQGDYLGFPIGLKSKNVEIVLTVKCRWIRFSGLRGESQGSPKNTNLVEDVGILLPVKFRWILFSGFRGVVEMFQPIRGQGGLSFPICTKKTQTLYRTFGSCFLSSFVEFPWAVTVWKSKCENLTVGDRWIDDGQCVTTIVHLSLGSKNTNWVDGVDFFLSVNY